MKHLFIYSLVLISLSCKNSASPTAVEKDTVFIKSDEVPEKKTEEIKVVPPVVDSEPPKVYTEMDYIGRRNVVLTITESDCNTNPVGDIRPETWSISMAAGEIKMNVASDTKTITEYTGEMAGEQLSLKGKKETLMGTAGQATIRIWVNDKGKIEGTRKLSTYDKDSNPCSLEQTVKEQ